MCLVVYECECCFAILPARGFLHNCPDNVNGTQMDDSAAYLMQLFHQVVVQWVQDGGKVKYLSC